MSITVKNNGVYRDRDHRLFYGGKREAMIATRVNLNPFAVGDKVRYSREFLRKAKMPASSWVQTAKGEIFRVDGLLCFINWKNGPQNSVSYPSLEKIVCDSHKGGK